MLKNSHPFELNTNIYFWFQRSQSPPPHYFMPKRISIVQILNVKNIFIFVFHYWISRKQWWGIFLCLMQHRDNILQVARITCVVLLVVSRCFVVIRMAVWQYSRWAVEQAAALGTRDACFSHHELQFKMWMSEYAWCISMILTSENILLKKTFSYS